MYVCMRVCLFVCFYVCMYVCMYVCAYFMYVCMYACMHAFTYVCMNTCIYICIDLSIYLSICPSVCLSMKKKHVNMHAHTHTHTHVDTTHLHAESACPPRQLRRPRSLTAYISARSTTRQPTQCSARWRVQDRPRSVREGSRIERRQEGGRAQAERQETNHMAPGPAA